MSIPPCLAANDAHERPACQGGGANCVAACPAVGVSPTAPRGTRRLGAQAPVLLVKNRRHHVTRNAKLRQLGWRLADPSRFGRVGHQEDGLYPREERKARRRSPMPVFIRFQKLTKPCTTT